MILLCHLKPLFTKKQNHWYSYWACINSDDIYSWNKTLYKSVLLYLTERLRISGHSNLQSESGLVWMNVSWRYIKDSVKLNSNLHVGLKSSRKFLRGEKQIAGPSQLFILLCRHTFSIMNSGNLFFFFIFFLSSDIYRPPLPPSPCQVLTFAFIMCYATTTPQPYNYLQFWHEWLSR